MAENVPGRCVKPQSSRSTTYDCYFAFEAKDVCEVLELDVGLCSIHGEDRATYETVKRTSRCCCEVFGPR
jgi:hypothetical protein